MPTEVVAVIDTDGVSGDYPSHNAAIADAYGATGVNLVANNQWVNCRARATDGTWDTAQANVAGFTTSATCLIKVWCDPADTGGDGLDGSFRHKGVLPGAGQKIYVHKTTNTPLTVTSNNVHLIGLTFNIANRTADWQKTVYTVRTGSEIVECLIVSTVTGTGYYGPFGIVAESVNGSVKIIGNTVYGYLTGTSSAALWFVRTANAVYTAYANTIVDSKKAVFISSSGGTVVLKNNAECNCGTAPYDAGTTGSTNNAYDAGSDPGANGLDISAYDGADLFLNYAGDDFHVATTSPLLGAGANLFADAVYAVTTDIDNEARPNAAQDIGSDEYTAPPPSTFIASMLQAGNDNSEEEDLLDAFSRQSARLMFKGRRFQRPVTGAKLPPVVTHAALPPVVKGGPRARPQ